MFFEKELSRFAETTSCLASIYDAISIILSHMVSIYKPLDYYPSYQNATWF